MGNLLKADIFFFVTTIAVVLLTIGGIIIIFYIFRIVRNVSDVTDRLRDQTTKITEDLDELRKSGFRRVWGYMMRFGSQLFKKHNKRKNEKKHKE